MRKLILPAVLILLLAACGDSGDTTSTAGAGDDPAASTTTAAATTTVAATVTVPAGDPEFVVTRIAFGNLGFVEITNIGTAPGDLGGHWLCQQPSYFEIQPIVLEPGRSVWIAAGDGTGVTPGGTVVAVQGSGGALGQLAESGGEVGLYASNSFADSDAIRAFVEWNAPDGSPRSGRASVAAGAGIWTAGDQVEVPAGSAIMTAQNLPAISSADWLAGA
jgi:hypothetical protein